MSRSGLKGKFDKEVKAMKGQIKFAADKNQYSIQILVLLTMSLLFGLSQTLAAQVIKPKPTPPGGKKVIVIKDKRIKSLPPTKENINQLPLAPASLSMAEKRNLIIRTLSENQVLVPVRRITPYVTLNPKSTFVEDKGYLDFYQTLLLRTAAWFKGNAWEPFQGLTVGIKPQRAGQWLYVDCYVNFLQETEPILTVKTPDGVTSEQRVSTGHLQLIVFTENTLWQKFWLTHSPEGEWVFYSCEVSTVQ
jgi:hypothetical protein